jgi:hypothetical protein
MEVLGQPPKLAPPRAALLQAQNQVSDQIIAGLDSYRVARDKICEQMFFGIYGSPFVQSLLGINDDSEVRPAPSTHPKKSPNNTLAPKHTRRS